MAERTRLVTEVSNVTGQSAATVADEMTAVWNGYKATAQDAELYIDKLANVAAHNATSLAEMANGMSKVAAAANDLGVNFDQLEAQMATIISVTRQAPESVGTALKTIYARIGDLKTDGTDEFGISLGEVSNQLASMGIQILDQEGNIRDIGVVIEEVAQKWNTWTEAQRQAAAIAMAGKRQYNNLIALFSNWDMYVDSMEQAATAQGTLQQQQDTYMESTAAHLQRLEATWEQLYDTLIDESEVQGSIDAMQTMLDLVDKMIGSFGGGLTNSILGVGAVLSMVFQKQLGNAVNNFINRVNVAKQNLEYLRTMNDVLNQGAADGTGAASYEQPIIANNQKQYEIAEKLYNVHRGLTTEQFRQGQQIQQNAGALEEQRVQLERQNQLYIERSGLNQRDVDLVTNEINGYQILLDEIDDMVNYNEQNIDLYQGNVNLITDMELRVRDLVADENHLYETLSRMREVQQDILSLDEDQVNHEREHALNLDLRADNERQLRRLKTEFLGLLKNIEKQERSNLSVSKEELRNQQERINAVTQLKTNLNQIGDIKLQIKGFDQQIAELEKMGAQAQKTNMIVSGITTSLGMFASGWMSISSIFNTIGDDSLTTSQKTQQLLMSISMLAGTVGGPLVKGIMGASKAFKLKKAAEEASTKATELGRIAVEKRAAADWQASENRNVQAALVNNLNKEIEANTALSRVNTQVISLQNLARSEGNELTKIQMASSLTNKEVTDAETASEILEAEAARISAEGKQARRTASLNSTFARQQEILAAEEEAATELAEKAATDAETASKKANTASLTLNREATEQLNNSKVALIATYLAEHQVMALGLGVLAALAVALMVYINNQKKAAEAAKEGAEKSREYAKAKQEEVEAIKETSKHISELVTKYNELQEKQQSGEISQDNLRTSLYDLCQQYDLQDLALKTLIADYQDLNDVYKQAQRDIQTDLLENQIEPTQGAIQASLKASALSINAENDADFFRQISTGDFSTDNTNIEFSNARDFGDWWTALEPGAWSKRAAKEKQFLKELASLTNASGAITGEFWHEFRGNIDLTNDIDTLTKNREALNSLMARVAQDAELAGSEVYTVVKKWLDENSELLDNWAANQKQRYQIVSEQLLEENPITDQASYDKLREELEKKYIEINPNFEIDSKGLDEAIDEFLKDQVTNEQVRAEFERDKISEVIAETDQDSLQLLKDLTTKELDYIYNHFDEFSTLYKGDLEQFLNDTRALVDNYVQNNQRDSILSTLQQAKKGDFKEESVSNLFAAQGMDEHLGMSQGEFSSLDYAQQLNTLTLQYITDTRSYVDNANQRKAALEAERQSIEANKAIQEEYNKVITDYSSNVGKLLTAKQKELIESHNINIEQVGKLLAEYEKLVDEYDDEIKAKNEVVNGNKDLEEILESLIDENSKNSEGLLEIAKGYNKANKETKIYEETITSITKELDKINEGIFITQEDLEDLASAAELSMSDVNSSFDSLQSAYKTLESAMEDYNDDGMFTLDTVQSLISLSPEYVSCLQLEGNTLSFNTQRLQDLVLAKIEDAKMSVQLRAYTELLKIAMQDQAVAASYGAEYTRQLEKAMGDTAVAAAEAAAQISNVANAIYSLGNAQSRAAADRVMSGMNMQLAALDNVGSSVRSGGVSFGKAMGGGSKGGGGGGSDNRDEEQKYWDEEFDRWWEYKNNIEIVEKELQRYQKYRDKMAGDQLADALEEENKLIAEQRDRIHEYSEAIERELGSMRAELAQFNYGITFDSEGYIMNYVEATSKAVAEYNDAVVKYNAKEMDEKTFEAIKKSYDRFKEMIDQYEEYVKTKYDNATKEEELRRQEMENRLQAWEARVEVKLDLKQAKRDWNDFIKNINSDFKKVYKDLNREADYFIKQMETYNGAEGTVNTRISAIHDVIAEINKMSSGGTSDMFNSISEAQEKLKELRDSLMEDIEDVHQLWEDAWETYLDGIDQAKDKFDQLNDTFEHFADELEYYGELMELIYGEEAYDQLDKLYKAQEQSSRVQLDSLVQQRDMWKQLWEDSGATFQNMSDWTEDQQKYYENWLEAQEDLNDSVTEYIQLLQTDYLNAVHKVVDELQNKIVGGDIEDAKQKLQDALEWDDLVYDAVEKVYEIQSLDNKIEQELAKAPANSKYQKQLLEFRERELAALNEKDHLTEHDIEMTNLKLQLLEKQAALEDAQNAKDTMKLTRNEQGNWSYQYVADEDDIASKQQEYLDVWHELYETSKEYDQQMRDSLLSLYEEYQTRLLTIAEDMTLTTEERQQKIAELEEWYYQMYEFYAGQMAQTEDELQTATVGLITTAHEQNVDSYAWMTESQREMLEELTGQTIETWADVEDLLEENYNGIAETAQETMGETLAYWDDAAKEMANLWNADDGASVKSMVLDAMTQIEAENDYYAEQMAWVSDEVGLDFENIAGHAAETADVVASLTNITGNYVSSAMSGLAALQQVVANLEGQFRSLAAAAIDAFNAINAALGAQQELQKAQEVAKYNSSPGDMRANGSGSGDGNGGSGGGGVFSGSSANVDTDLGYAVIKTNGHGAGGATLFTMGTSNKPMSSESAGQYALNLNNREGSGDARYISVPVSSLSSYGISSFSSNRPAGTSQTVLSAQEAKAVSLNTQESRDNYRYRQLSSVITAGYAAGDWQSLLPKDRRALQDQGITGADYNWFKQYYKKINGYATGGYTGDWNTTDGKLAILHEKELVLNKDDTANILSAVDSMRHLNDSIGNTLMSTVLGAVLGLKNISPGTVNTVANNTSTETNNTYHIDTLEFPNVRDVTTMMQAIESLPLIASQVVHRTGSY